jgi:plastocyanin
VLLDANHSHFYQKAPVGAKQLRLKRRFGALAILLCVPGAAAWTSSASAEKRFFTILAVEPKGGTTVDKEPFPTGPLPPGGGYVIAQPDEKTRRWEVSAYIWQPSQIIVNEGDEVTLEFVGINGAAHPTTIAAFGQTFTVKRGQAHRATFTADKVGIFGIICSTHKPSMSGELIVMPKR